MYGPRPTIGNWAKCHDAAIGPSHGSHWQLAHKLSSDVVTLPSSNAEAYDLYLRAMVAGNSLNQRSLLEDFTRVEHWLDRAIELDSKYAGAYALRAQFCACSSMF